MDVSSYKRSKKRRYPKFKVRIINPQSWDGFTTTFTILDNIHPSRLRTERTAEAMAAVDYSRSLRDIELKFGMQAAFLKAEVKF